MKQKPSASGLARLSRPRVLLVFSFIHLTPAMKLSARTNPFSISFPQLGQFIPRSPIR